MRAFNGDYDEEFTRARIAEIRTLLDSAGRYRTGRGLRDRASRGLPQLTRPCSRRRRHLPADAGSGTGQGRWRGFPRGGAAPAPGGRPERRSGRVRSLPEHPSDIWTLQDWCPVAAQATRNGDPILIFWHFLYRGSFRPGGPTTAAVHCVARGHSHAQGWDRRAHEDLGLDRVARSVVISGCENDDLCFGDDVDEAVLVVDPP